MSRVQINTSVDYLTADKIKELKEKRGITAGGLLRVGVDHVLNPENAQIKELQEANATLRAKLQANVLRVYELEARVKELEGKQGPANG